MKQLQIEWLLFNQEIKLYENNWIKNTVTGLTKGSKPVNSRLICLGMDAEVPIPLGQRNTQNEKRSLSSKNPHPFSKNTWFPLLHPPLTLGPRKAKATTSRGHTMLTLNKTWSTNETLTGSQKFPSLASQTA